MTFWREFSTPSPLSKQGAREQRFDPESDGFGVGVFLATKDTKSFSEKNFKRRKAA